MPPEKRPADALGSTQMVVKRQKSNLDVGGGRAVALANGNAKNGALIQAVSVAPWIIVNARLVLSEMCKEGRLMER